MGYIKKNSKYGVSKLLLFEDFNSDDFDMVSLIAVSTFIIFQRYIENMVASRIILSSAIANSARTRIRK